MLSTLVFALQLANRPVRSADTGIYLDVKPANTSLHLASIRQLPLSTFRLSYERSDAKRNARVGVIGPELVAIIPDAVDVVPQRTLPPRDRGGKPVVLHNFPSVNEQTLFMYGVGATQELARTVDKLEEQIQEQRDRLARAHGEVGQLEDLLAASSDGDAELRMREAAAAAEIAKHEMETAVARARGEEEYAEAARAEEEEQARRSARLARERLAREDAAARVRTERALAARLKASRRIERTRAEAAEAVAAAEHERELLLQKAAEEMKVETAKAVARAKAEAERANEDVHLRKLQAESEQRRKRNAAAINAVFSHLSTALSAAVKNPKQVLTFIGYVCLLTGAIFLARGMSRLIRSIIEAAIGKPQLIRETTRRKMPWSIFSYFAHLMSCVIPWRNRKVASIEESFDDLILPKELKERVLDLARSARNARRHNAPFRHVLLYGPPGTGESRRSFDLSFSIH